MNLRADFTMKEVMAPQNMWCRGSLSGHTAPELFQRDPQQPPSSTRFFSVSSDIDTTINGVYCEICLIVANAMARGKVILQDGVLYKNG